MDDDRRRLQRIPTEPIGLFTLTTRKGVAVPCTLVNITPEGMMAHSVNELEDGAVAEGHEVVLKEFSATMAKVVRKVEGEVRWVAGDTFGVAFTEPLDLDPAALHEFLHREGLTPWANWEP